MANVKIYTTNYCPFCRAAKNLLKSKDVTFTEIDVTEDSSRRQWLKQETDQLTVPQIFINDKSIGGYQELTNLDKEGKLDKLLE